MDSATRHEKLRAELTRAIATEAVAYQILESWRHRLDSLPAGSTQHFTVSRHVAFRLQGYRACRIRVGQLSRQVGVL